MNRRHFLGTLGLVVGGIAIERAIPLGRVWSFPKEIKIPTITATISEYADWISWSDLVVDCAIDPHVVKCANELSYRAGLSIQKFAAMA